MTDKAHGHNIIDETFYFVEGKGKMIFDGKEYEAAEGSIFLIEPKEMHNLKNDSDDTLKVVFIKGDYKLDDKME